MNLNIPDDVDRQQALNPTKSFIVQAPAGSGKTELLTQRFLTLLSLVNAPEEILAITFTKKSAAEMRARIINAIKQASFAPAETLSAHAKKTYALAAKILERDQLLKWNLLNNPNRLRIQTIDSFNASLTKQLPILSHFGATPDITHDSFELYREAVQELLSHLEENLAWSDAIAHLLTHMDNDLARVEILLINMLAKRDQWLPYITTNLNHPTLRAQLENHLSCITQEAVTKVLAVFPVEESQELLQLAKFAAENLQRGNVISKITACANLTSLPNNKEDWLALSELLLTKELTWRKRLDKNLGFLPPSASENADEKFALTTLKKSMEELIARLSNIEQLRIALQELNLTPNDHYDEAQWETLSALYQVLMVAVAQLKLIFQQHGKIDYIENTQAALLALGSDESPTDIALALDYQIRHILVDEFQDTSHSQYRLLEKLTLGWEDNDGRTLFAVGDPMQSIYRFREAEVGLFIRSQKKGLGNIRLIPLRLSVNFRSTPCIVNWINHCFATVFPEFDDVATGAVSFCHSRAIQTDISSNSFVKIHSVLDKQENTQALRIIELIQETKKTYPDETIAILVRSRNHLAEIIPALKQANITYKAIDIDPLTSRPVIQDLLALTRALLHPSDRIAWLAILRAPWCGITLSDLLILTDNKPHISIIECISDPASWHKLSSDGQQRLQRVRVTLLQKLNERFRYTLRTWIESTWILLGGPACLDQPSDLKDVNSFLNLLEKLDQGSDYAKLNLLNDYVSQLYAAPNNQADDSLQIMTIHNAKGLEFDTVILPQLERRSPNDEKQLLLWMERSSEISSDSLIIAPIPAVNTDNSIYEYIKRQGAIKADYETGRLLYVAATRAKKQLHLFFNLQSKDQEICRPATGSLLQKMAEAIKDELSASVSTSFTQVVEQLTVQAKKIKRLSSDWINPVKEETAVEKFAYHQQQQGFLIPDYYYKNIGIMAHQILQQICCSGAVWWQNMNSAQQVMMIENKLKQIGTQQTKIPMAIETICLAIENTLKDARGRWIIHPHAFAQNEYALTALIENSVKSFIIDRTFVDKEGIRWIIDYKTSICLDGNCEEFLVEEQNRYSKQMQAYFLAMREMDSRPIKLGLYFPLMSAWREWVGE